MPNHLLNSILSDPSKAYRKGPWDVVRDRRFNKAEKQQILKAWDAQGDPLMSDHLTVAALALEDQPNV